MSDPKKRKRSPGEEERILQRMTMGRPPSQGEPVPGPGVPFSVKLRLVASERRQFTVIFLDRELQATD